MHILFVLLLATPLLSVAIRPVKKPLPLSHYIDGWKKFKPEIIDFLQSAPDDKHDESQTKLMMKVIRHIHRYYVQEKSTRYSLSHEEQVAAALIGIVVLMTIRSQLTAETLAQEAELQLIGANLYTLIHLYQWTTWKHLFFRLDPKKVSPADTKLLEYYRRYALQTLKDVCNRATVAIADAVKREKNPFTRRIGWCGCRY